MLHRRPYFDHISGALPPGSTYLRGACGVRLKDIQILGDNNERVYERCDMGLLCKWGEVWCSGLGENKYFKVIWLS